MIVPDVYPRDGHWYALTLQNGLYVETGPYGSPQEAAINAQMIMQSAAEQQDLFAPQPPQDSGWGQVW